MGPLQQLKGRVLVKGKKLPAAWSEDGRILSDQEEEEEEEEGEAEAAEQRRRVSGTTGPAGRGWEELLWEGKEARRTEGAGASGPPLRLISQAKQISPELSALVVYCCATRLRTLHPNPVPPQPCQVSSLNERKAKKLIREAGRSWDIRHGGLEAPWRPAVSWWGGILKLVWKGD